MDSKLSGRVRHRAERFKIEAQRPITFRGKEKEKNRKLEREILRS